MFISGFNDIFELEVKENPVRRYSSSGRTQLWQSSYCSFSAQLAKCRKRRGLPGALTAFNPRELTALCSSSWCRWCRTWLWSPYTWVSQCPFSPDHFLRGLSLTQRSVIVCNTRPEIHQLDFGLPYLRPICPTSMSTACPQILCNVPWKVKRVPLLPTSCSLALGWSSSSLGSQKTITGAPGCPCLLYHLRGLRWIVL